jgi:hypothetical protein
LIRFGYLTNWLQKARLGFTKITVHARNYHDIFFDNLPKGTGIRWEFVTEAKDISFQVFYPGPSGEIKQPLINMEKTNAHETPIIVCIPYYFTDLCRAK